MSTELVVIVMAIALVWGVFGKPDVIEEKKPRKVRSDDVAPREEGEERSAAEERMIAEEKAKEDGPPNQVNHHSKQDSGNLATDTFKRLKEKSNVKFE